MMPADVRRCICSFAFTPRSCLRFPRAPRGPDLLRMSFGVSFYTKYRVPISGKWRASVPVDATLNDLCRLVHAKLCKEGRTRRTRGVYDDFDLLNAVVGLLAVPFFKRDYRPGIMLPYYYQAHCFQRFATYFPKRKGLLHVQAIATSKEGITCPFHLDKLGAM